MTGLRTTGDFGGADVPHHSALLDRFVHTPKPYFRLQERMFVLERLEQSSDFRREACR